MQRIPEPYLVASCCFMHNPVIVGHRGTRIQHVLDMWNAPPITTKVIGASRVVEGTGLCFESKRAAFDRAAVSVPCIGTVYGCIRLGARMRMWMRRDRRHRRQWQRTVDSIQCWVKQRHVCHQISACWIELSPGWIWTSHRQPGG